jgi:penicillin-binding protein 1A
VANFRAGRIVQGGSTISQQYIKNVYLGDDQSLARKVEEALLAYQLEARWSKDRILTAYLNTVYYGQGAYGVQAAAQTYFHRNVWQLSLAQCAQLAALPRDPTAYSPLYAPEAARARRNLVLSRMAREGYISAAQRRRAATASPRVHASAPAHHTADTAYFLDYLTRELTRRYGTRAVFEGGLRVYSSLDLRMQRAALRALRETLPPGPAGALVSIAARSGYIRAMATTADHKVSKFNLATQSRRQLGSAMKPFALAAAVAQGADPQSTYYVSAPQHLYLGPDQEPAYWDVATYSHTYSGPIDLEQATWQSDNTVYAQLAMDLGPDKIASVARRMGITSPIPALPSIVLGTASVNPLEVAVAYATLANGGVRHKPEAIERVKFPDGSVEATHRSGKRVLPAGVPYVVDRSLQDNTR